MNRFRTIALTAVTGFVLVACGPAASGGSEAPGNSEAAASQAQASSGEGVQPSFTAGAVADLEALIPDTVGEMTLTKESTKGDEFIGSAESDPAVAKFIEDLGVSPGDISLAFGFGFSADASSSIAMFVFRAAGADTDRLVSAFKEANDADRDAPLVWTSASVGGKSVETASDTGQNLYLYAKDDILFFVSGDPASTEEAISELPEPRSAAIFVNEGAGSAHSKRVRSAVSLTRRALDADLHVTATRDRDELRAFLDERIGPYGTIVVVGGDGSLGVAYNAVADRDDITLGYIPAGFGNATSHLLKLPRHPAALAGVLLAADARPIDLVSVNGRLALFAGAGWDADVARRYAEGGAKRLRGWASAVTSSLPDLRRRHRVRVVADGETIHEGPMILTVASTTPFYGRGLLVNPGARPDGGQLTARVYAGPTAQMAAEVGRWAARREPAAKGVSASSLTISSLTARPIPLQADGDHVGEAGEWQFEVRPAAVRLIGKW